MAINQKTIAARLISKLWEEAQKIIKQDYPAETFLIAGLNKGIYDGSEPIDQYLIRVANPWGPYKLDDGADKKAVEAITPLIDKGCSIAGSVGYGNQ